MTAAARAADPIRATLEEIAAKHLDLETLEQRFSDRLDFHDLSVMSIEAALRAAYEAGAAAAAPAKRSRATRTTKGA